LALHRIFALVVEVIVEPENTQQAIAQLRVAGTAIASTKLIEDISIKATAIKRDKAGLVKQDTA
jgi:hypothetical protein